MTITETVEAVEAPIGDLNTLFMELRRVRDRLAAEKALEKQLLDALRDRLGDATELVDETGAAWATWRAGKPREVVDWDGVVAALEADGIDIAPTVAAHTTVKPGARTLRVDAGLKRADAAALTEDLF